MPDQKGQEKENGLQGQGNPRPFRGRGPVKRGTLMSPTGISRPERRTPWNCQTPTHLMAPSRVMAPNIISLRMPHNSAIEEHRRCHAPRNSDGKRDAFLTGSLICVVERCRNQDISHSRRGDPCSRIENPAHSRDGVECLAVEIPLVEGVTGWDGEA